MRRAAQAKPHNRDGIWYLVRRVPKAFAALDRRVIVRMSTEIAVADDPRGIRAGEVVKRLDAELAAYWRGIRDGRSGEARIRFEAAQARARSMGFTYHTAAELADTGRLDDILARLTQLVEKNAVDDELQVAAVLGGEARPALMLSGLLDEFEALQRSGQRAMSPDQRRRWHNPRKRSLANFIEVVGDRPLVELNRDNAIAFRRWWQDRIARDGIDIGTANKSLGEIARMFSAVDMAYQLGLKPIFARLRIEGQTTGQRSAFTVDWVQSRILAAGALDGLNDEARHLVYVIADTGLRLSEAANLLPDDIKLDDEVPHVQIRGTGRKLKTEQSAREIPLVGTALAAMRLHSEGFPRYRDKASSLSALVNKAMRNRDLLPTDNHSLYSLRHTFEDRLTAVEAPEKVIATLMGHKWMRPKYGAGPSLAQKQDWLAKIAFTPPRHL